MPPVDVDPRAVREANQARRRYARVSRAVAGRFATALDDAVARIGANPQSGTPYHHGTRVCRLRGFPYHLVYVEQPAEVLVVAVPHDRRRRLP
jgi:plasmid stabilization system protein ParE